MTPPPSKDPPLTITRQNYKKMNNRGDPGKGSGRRVENLEAIRANWPFPPPKRIHGWQEQADA